MNQQEGRICHREHTKRRFQTPLWSRAGQAQRERGCASFGEIQSKKKIMKILTQHTEKKVDGKRKKENLCRTSNTKSSSSITIADRIRNMIKGLQVSIILASTILFRQCLSSGINSLQALPFKTQGSNSEYLSILGDKVLFSSLKHPANYFLAKRNSFNTQN